MDEDDEADLKKAAKLTLGFAQEEIDRLVEAGTLIEVERNDEEERQDLSE